MFTEKLKTFIYPNYDIVSDNIHGWKKAPAVENN